MRENLDHELLRLRSLPPLDPNRVTVGEQSGFQRVVQRSIPDGRLLDIKLPTLPFGLDGGCELLE